MRILSYICAGLMGAAITIGVSAAAVESAAVNRSGPTAQVQPPRQMGQVGAQREPTLPDSTLSGAPGWAFPGGGTNRVTLPTCQDRNASNFGQIGSCVYPIPTCTDSRALNYGAVGSCVYPQCTGGQVWNGSACACPTGTTWNGSSCVRPPSCPAGQVWNGSACEDLGWCGMPPGWGPDGDPGCYRTNGGWRCYDSGNGGWRNYYCP